MKVDIATKDDYEKIVEKINYLTELVTNKTNKTKKDRMKSKEACELFKCSASTLKNWRDRGEIEFEQIGGTYYYFPNSKNQQNG